MSSTWPSSGAQQPQGTDPSEVVPAPRAMPAPPAYGANPVPGFPVTTPTVPATRGMYTAAAIINWVTLGIVIVATLGFGVIAAAWFVPMTILTHRAAKGPYKHTALAVCTLLFVNIISGILMLVDDSNRPPKPAA